MLEAETEEGTIMNRKVYFERLQLLPIQINFTLTRMEDSSVDPFKQMFGGIHFFIRCVSGARRGCSGSTHAHCRTQDYHTMGTQPARLAEHHHHTPSRKQRFYDTQ